MDEFVIHLKFYNELNDFLPRLKRNRILGVKARDHQTVKDIIEDPAYLALEI